MRLRVVVGLSTLGGRSHEGGFNAWLVILPEVGNVPGVEYNDFPLLQQNTTFDKAKERALEFTRTKIQVYHQFGKDGFELIDS